MMSPLTVSQFLPPSLHFDAVIFDEASQVRPSDAINCIYRGSQLIIAGDDQQLPPTSFFEAVSVDGDDEWEEDQFEEFESVLKLGKGSAGLRELPLKWHYRSQHEDLIAYSNYSFYEGRLVTFPGAAAEAGDLGVKFYPVTAGVYRRGTARDNPKEAEVVVERVLHWARYSLENPARAVTLGVVAFSEAQANAIEVALDRRRQDLPELDAFFAEDRLDGFFVKNLENVQGDERDVMIFSVGYGRDENGKLTMNFGPLNREGGERRLNVAITRARRRVELVASITGTEPEFATTLREGPRHLQRYLDYAARGPAALAIELGESAFDAESPFEEEVMRTIRSWGYKVQPQVGTAGYRVDIGVWHPQISGRFALGIECDGRMYHSSAVARDRDRLRQEVLERLGWRIYRIWGTSWYRYRSEQEERLKAAITAAIADSGDHPTGPPAKAAASARRQEQSFEEVALDKAPSWTVAYRVASPAGPRPWVEMHLPEAQYDLRRMILEVVEVEGPIEDELLLRRVREAWGIARAGNRIRDAFRDALESLRGRGLVSRTERSYTYTHPSQLQVVRVPGGNQLAERSAMQIPRTEAKLAVQHIIDDARRVSRDELTSEVSRLFGWNRRGPDIAAALDGAVDALVREGLIVEAEGFLKTTVRDSGPQYVDEPNGTGSE
jgi:very-short-patch-repair endonuclease